MTIRTGRTPGLAGASNRIRLQIAGMSCSSCVDHVRSALSGVAGIHVIDVLPGFAVIELNPEADGLAVVRALWSAGYELIRVTPLNAREPAVRRSHPESGRESCCGREADRQDLLPEPAGR